MPRDIERLPSGSNLEHERQMNPVARQADSTRDRIDAVAGREIRESSPYPRVEQYPRAEPVRTVERENPARRDAQDALQGVLQSVGFLVDAQDEHRNPDFRSRVPIIGGIWDMVRSHSIAGKEAQSIEQVKEEMAHLEQVVADGGLALDLKPLKDGIAQLSPPGGISKLLGSVFQGFRRFHREWYTPTVEDIRLKARDLQLQLRRSSGPQYSVAA